MSRPGFSTRLASISIFSFFSITIRCVRNSRFSRKFLLLTGLTVLQPHILLPQISRIIGLPAPPAPITTPTVLTPDRIDHLPRPDAPPIDRSVITSDERQTSEGGIYHLRGHAKIELNDSLLTADEIDYNEETGDAQGRGNVFYENFAQNEKITCDRVDYNVETEIGKFYNVQGYLKGRVDTRPGRLTSDNPFYFQGKWADRIDGKYILHHGLVTGCKLPRPWYTLRGPRFDITPGENAKAYHSWFRIRQFPLFYTPFFYKSLEKQPRQSGFLAPNLGHSSLRGFLLGIGYYWAINRSYDATYRFQYFSEGSTTHHLDLRGKPTEKSDFNLIAYGAQDSIIPKGQTTSYSGVDATLLGKADLGGGWYSRLSINYLSSLGFRQQFSESFATAIFSASQSDAFVGKHFGVYSFDVAVDRTQLFQTVASRDFVILRKLPEVNFSGRDNEITPRDSPVPVWFSFGATADLLHRSDPREVLGGVVVENRYETSQLMPRLDAEPRVETAFRWDGFTIMPSFTLHENYFGQSFAAGTQTGSILPLNAIVNSAILRSAEEFTFDITTPSIERVYDKKTIFGDKLKHVIEPRVEYRYVTGVEDFNRLVRFDTTELLNDTSELEYSVTNRVYAKRGDTVAEILTWTVAQQRYFDPTFGRAVVAGQRNVIYDSLELSGYAFLNGPRNYSPVYSNLRVSPITGVALSWQADYDPLRKGLVDSGLSIDVRYRKLFMSAGNNEVKGVLVTPSATTANHITPYISPPANQFRALAGFGDTNRRGWNGAASMIYDYRTGVLDYLVMQGTYNTDCCGFSAQVVRLNAGIHDDTQYRVAFTIANIGAFGNLKKQERLF